ncbi:hypothetical protein DSM112329_00788 [Paraconexibacter sp. AEG42_29]|uniref:Cell wall-active antibiotics response LiaF-like C-terminal domain-containing protein n=1 Tax=Paraconexibacter sp. AEG42_29 TaxID=2997339 RepID=A0AAU7AQR9_9ACTN
MSERPSVVRSYSRVFRPDRRIYAIDGRTLPIPGGVPLRWLGTATLVLIAGLLLAAVKPLVVITLAAVAGGMVWRLGRPRQAMQVAGGVALLGFVGGLMLRSLDWPLRLIVIPAVVATAATQLAPDGRAAHRFVGSWLRTQVAGRRRLGQPLAAAGEQGTAGGELRVAHDSHGPVLRRARIHGPATVTLSAPVFARRRWRRRSITPLHSAIRGGVMLDRVELSDGERLEVRP